MLRRALLVLGLTALSACGDGPTSPSDVIGDTWSLISLQETGATNPTVVSDPSRYQITFNADSRLSVKSDCNSCSGSYSITRSTLAVAALACTRAFCGVTSLDAGFAGALQQAGRIDVDKDELTIQSANAVMRFKR